MWLLANMIAQQSSVMGRDGKGMAVVAEETRIVSNKILEMVDKALYGNEEIEKDHIREIVFEMNILALNCAIECSRLGVRGQPTVVCIEDIRTIIYNISLLLDEDKLDGYYGYTPMPAESYAQMPIPKNRVKSSDYNNELMLLRIGDVYVVELLSNIKEICVYLERTETHVKVQGMEVPLIDGFKKLDKKQEKPTYVFIQTPWAEKNKTYAVSADVLGLFYSPSCQSADVESGIPLAEYVRDYWESENEIPFIFMDWTKM